MDERHGMAARRPLPGKSGSARARSAPKQRPLWLEILTLAGVLLAALFVARIVSAIGMMGIAVGAGPFLLIALFFTAGLIPFLLGLVVHKWGWLLGIAYTALYLFVLLPWYLWGEFRSNYMWTPRGAIPRNPPWIIIPIIVIGAIAFSLLGSFLPLKKSRLRINIERPMLSLAPIVGVSIALALLAPVGMYPLCERASVLVCPEYAFKLKVPSGWHGLDSSFGGEKYVVSGYDAVREQAIAEIELGSTVGAPIGGGTVRIFVYKNMPFTGEPLSNFGSREEVYEALRTTLEGEKNRSEQIVLQRFKDCPTLIKFHWNGKTTIGGIQAYRVYYHTKQIDPMVDTIEEVNEQIVHEQIPEDIYRYDIVVYRDPYLYWLQMWIEPPNAPAYNEIKDSFKFVESDK